MRFIRSTLPVRALWLLVAGLVLAGPAGAAEDFLPVRDAYKVSTGVEAGQAIVRYDIAPGYYLYRDRLGFESATPGVTIGAASLPVGEDHEDDYFGKQVIYRGVAKIGLRLTFDGPPRSFELRLRLQGCADAGLCYPPQNWVVPVKWIGPAPTAPAAAATTTGESSGGFDLRRLIGAGGSSGSDADFLPPDQAFVFSATSSRRDQVTLRWVIADDYYLYRDKVKVTALAPGVQLGAPRMPAGKTKHDEYFGDQTVYFGELLADVPISAATDAQDVPLEVTYQGCAEAGLCYPPIHKKVTVRLAPVGTASAATTSPAANDGAGQVRSEQDLLADKIRTGSFAGIIGFFFVIGLGLSLTPCVLPMVPILSGIIVGAGSGTPVSRGRAFALSLAYVLGMAVTYTVAGAAFAAAGQQAQAVFQKPWIIALFAALFVWLALGMFGVFTLQVPVALQSRISNLSNRQKQGTLPGTAIIGALSSLIVTACVAPALVASLAVIGQGGDVLRGGAALFSMSLGMGAPLLLVGASAGHLLPKAGPWMDAVKAVFGVLLLGVAVWMLSRILPGAVTLALWAVLAFVTGFCLLTLGGREIRNGTDAVRRGLGALAVVYGVIMLIGALSGRSDPLQPLAGLGGTGGVEAATPAASAAFHRIKTVSDLDRAVQDASAAGRPVMLDFYADWCVSCKEMEKFTFPDPAVRAALSRAVLLQADVTANDADDQALLRRFGILGPPTIVFFGPDGRERPEYRVVGFKDAADFGAHLARAFGTEHS